MVKGGLSLYTMKEERTMICYHELKEREGNGLLS